MLVLSEETTRMSFVLPKDLKKEIENHAKSKGLSVSSYLRMIAINDLEKTAQKENKKV